jgi:selenophosphate synthetase-related protein
MYSMRPGIFGAAVISDTIIVNNNLAPADFVDDANTALVNGYAGDITVTGAGPRLHVDHDAVPQEACVEVLKNLGQGRGFETVGVASSIGGLSGATVQTLPIADPSSLCTTDPVAIRFTFRY